MERPRIPYISDRVIYRSKIDNGDGNDVLSAAVVIRTRGTTVPEVMNRWGPSPDAIVHEGKVVNPAPRPPGVEDELPDEMTVDILVNGLGRDYREYSVPFSPTERGCWHWAPYSGNGA
jgi:hypothetical protein